MILGSILGYHETVRQVNRAISDLQLPKHAKYEMRWAVRQGTLNKGMKVGAQLGILAGSFSAVKMVAVKTRGVHDFWNSVIAGPLAGGLTSIIFTGMTTKQQHNLH